MKREAIPAAYDAATNFTYHRGVRRRTFRAPVGPRSEFPGFMRRNPSAGAMRSPGRITPQISDAPMRATQNKSMVGARSLHLLVRRHSDAPSTHVTSPAFEVGMTVSSFGINTRRSSRRFVGARRMTTAIEKTERSRWKGRFRSTVTKMSNCPCARLSNSPFFKPAQPASGTVRTSCPLISLARRRSTHSSSSTFTSRGLGG